MDFSLLTPVGVGVAAATAGYFVRIGHEALKRKLDDRRYAFNLQPGVGPSWIVRRLRKPAAVVEWLVVWDEMGHLKFPWTKLDVELKKGHGGYGWDLGLVSGDMFEIHWTENGRSFSTNQRIFDDREYLLRRENTGH